MLNKFFKKTFFKFTQSGKLLKLFKFKIIVCIYAAILFLLNFIRIFDNNFWGDEAFTINLVKHTLPEIITITSADVHPPLYYFIVKLGYMIFGSQSWMFHLVSLIPCAIIFIFSLTTVWEKFGKETAIILITLAGLSQNAVTYNMEVRMYSWGALFILFSFYELYCILSEEKSLNYVLFALFSLAAAYTHYYCLISVAFFYVVILFLSIFIKRLNLKKVLITCICTVAGYLPWFLIMLKSFLLVKDEYWITEIPTFEASIQYMFSEQFSPLVLNIIIFGIFLVYLYETGIMKAEKTGSIKFNISFAFDNIQPPTIILTWVTAGIASIVGTVCFGIILSRLTRPLYFLRYAYPVSIVAWIILGITISKLKGKKIYAFLMLIYMLFVFIPDYKSTYIFEKETNDRLESTLHATLDEMGKEDVIFTNEISIEWSIAPYYYPDNASIMIDLSSFPELEDDITYWLIVTYEPEMDSVYKEIEKQGFSHEEIVSNGILGVHEVRIYLIKKIL